MTTKECSKVAKRVGYYLAKPRAVVRYMVQMTVSYDFESSKTGGTIYRMAAIVAQVPTVAHEKEIELTTIFRGPARMTSEAAAKDFDDVKTATDSILELIG